MRKSDFSATLLVVSGYVLATLTGFLRQAALAYHLGAGRETDIYLVAYAIPELFFIALPIILAPAVIPLLVGCRLQEGEKAAGRFAVQLFTWLSGLLILLTALAWLLAPVYIPWLALGFLGSEQQITIQAARQMLPAIVLMGLATLASAVLQVYRSFARPAFVTVVFNGVFVAGLFVLPMPQPLDRATWSVVGGALAALLIQLPIFARLVRQSGVLEGGITGYLFRPGSQICQAVGLAGPLALGYGVHHLILFIDRAMATTQGAGNAALLSYANHLALVIVQVSGLAVSTVLFPSLAEQVDHQAYGRAREILAAALRWVWITALPATVFMVVLREPLIRFLLERGAFDTSDTQAMSLPLMAYCAAALADSLCQPLWRVIYAQRSPWKVIQVNGVQTVVRLILNGLLIGPLGITGLALSAVFGLWVQFILLGGIVSKRMQISFRIGWYLEVLQVILAVVPGALLAGLILFLLQPSFPILGLLIFAGGAGIGFYAAILLLIIYRKKLVWKP